MTTEAGSTGTSAGPTETTQFTTTDPSSTDPSSTDPSSTDPSSTETTTDSSTDSETDSETSGNDTWDGEPLPDMPAGGWFWVEFLNSHCLDGSPAGIGVRYGSVPKLLILFDGGGACFNDITCEATPSAYSEINFELWADSFGGTGIFNINLPNNNNPVDDWHHIYIPYCTGDFHAGSKITGGDNESFFVGYINAALFLESIVPTFLDVEAVLVAGQGSGGFGAMLNFDRIAQAFPMATTSLLNDSGPFFREDYLAPCLESQWRTLWDLEKALPENCFDCFTGGLFNLAPYLAEKYDATSLGLLSSSQDDVNRLIFGYGTTSNTDITPCSSQGTPQQQPSYFEEGLLDLRDNVLVNSVWATYIIESQNHAWIVSDDGFLNTEVNQVRIYDWLEDIIEGNANNVSP